MPQKKKGKQTLTKEVDPFEETEGQPLLQMPLDGSGRNTTHEYYTEEKNKIDRRKLPIDWDKVESLYIFGNIVQDKKTREYRRKYPTLRELSTLTRASVATVGRRSREGNWPDRRYEYLAQLRREVDDGIAKARAISMVDAVSGIDNYLATFLKAIQSNAVDTSRIDYFEKAVRLKVFMAKEMQGVSAASNSEIPFDEIQRTHSQLRLSGSELTNELAGKVQGRTEREREHGTKSDGLSILSEKTRKRDRDAALSALTAVKGDTVNGWITCDLAATS